MNRIKIAQILTFVALLFLFSCENEPVDPALLLVSPDCHAPTSFSVSNFINGNSVNLSWDNSAQSDTWEVEYGVNGFLHGTGTTVVLSSTSTVINGLTSTTDYDFYIRTKCSATAYSNWLGPVSVGSSYVSCSEPGSMLVVRSLTDDTKATISWTPGATETRWEIQYGIQGFDLGTSGGTIIASTTTSKVISNLLANSGYDFYLRSKCSSTESSGWVGPYTIPPVGAPSGDDYWPRAINNQWVFAVNNVNQDPMKIISTDVIGGNTYYTFQQTGGSASATLRLRKSNAGDYYLRMEEVTTAGGTTTGNETIILKDYESVGSTWTNNYLQTTTYVGLPPIDLSVSVVSTIMEKNASITVNGETFNNVIVVKRVMTTTGVGFPTSTVTSTYWFSNHIGPVKITTVSDSGTTDQLLTARILF